jgi:D-beta-D-heptose 7-phosphate kinase/D-beta-D-heptose 1-phosphate adenosyltransferase
MSLDRYRLLDAFAGLRVAVVGEAMLDTHLDGEASRFCPEGPVPAVSVSARHDLPGGAANTAANAAGLGAHAFLLSVTGEDAEAALLRQALQARGIPLDGLLAVAGRQTLTRQRVLAGGQLLLRLDYGSTGPIADAAQRRLAERLAALWAGCQAVILSDYRYSVLRPGLLRAVADLQAKTPRVLVADTRRPGLFRGLGLTAFKANYAEIRSLLGEGLPERGPGRVSALAGQGDRLLDMAGARLAAVTLDRDGALVFERGQPPVRTAGVTAPSGWAAGAGDNYTAALALALAAGADTPQAAALAADAAAVAVSRERTAYGSADDLRAAWGHADKYVPDRHQLAVRIAVERAGGRRIVFTNGCFDLLYRGHVALLERAKGLGDLLVVGVNTDAGIHRLKGPGRPVNSLPDRLGVLAGLGSVDLLTAFDEDTPCALLRVICPDVFAKGADYTRERLPEAALVESWGGTVHLLPHLPERSTTGLIERIRGRRNPNDQGPMDKEVPMPKDQCAPRAQVLRQEPLAIGQ